MTYRDFIELYDSAEKKDIDELIVVKGIQALEPTDNKEERFVRLAEVMAFDFSENYRDEGTGWGTYFGPKIIWSNPDGSTAESPSLGRVTPEMITHWTKRANESTNPVLIARYSGLVWDFQERITSQRPSHEICRTNIQAIINIANGDFHAHALSTFSKLDRALGLAIGLNNQELVESTKQALLDFEREHSVDDKPGLWGYSFDLLVGNRKVSLTEQEEHEIIQELEDKLERVSNANTSEQNPDPWAAEAAATRLATYYRQKQKDEDIKRVLLKVGDAYEQLFKNASNTQVMGWLELLYRLYTKFSLRNEAENVLIKLRGIGPEAVGELKTISQSIQIPQEQIDEYVKQMTAGNIHEVLTRIAIGYIPIKEQAKEQLLELSKQAPLNYLLNQHIQDEKGRVIATVGPLKDDLEGHVIRQLSDSLYFSVYFLRQVISESIQKFSLGADEVTRFIEVNPTVDPSRLEIINKGLNAYFSNDFLVAIHLLIPQIEDAMRNLVEFAGGNVLKPSRGGGFHLRTFDEILRDDITYNSLGEDFISYFRLLFTDQRGWNLRNRVCHGTSNPDLFNEQTADRVLHAIICLGLIQDKKG